jgi:hypothetical protein
MKSQSNTNIVIRSSLALALVLVIWSPVLALSAGPGDGKMMEGNMMNQTDGWMGGRRDVAMDGGRHPGDSPARRRYQQADQQVVQRSALATGQNR